MFEIGSEFEWGGIHSNNEKCGLNILKRNSVLAFSGRTSIEVVLDNIIDINKAMLPSYCCDSMIEPFKKAGVDVCFYDVIYDGKLICNLNIPHDIDVLLWCNYFGYRLQMPDITDFKKRGGIVIEDITHSLLSDNMYDTQSDFLVASIRKWLPVLCGGYCASVNSSLTELPKVYPSEAFLNKKRNAMKLKNEYLADNDKKKKSVFLSMFSETNEWLCNNYTDLKIDKESERIVLQTDFDKIKQIRKRNAKFLHEGLKKCNYIKTLFSIELMDCPLFVPIIVENGKRDFIRKRLIENDIYCPVHWPKPEGCKSNLYDIELSLVCDQRYDEEDMRRIVDVLCDGIR